MTRKTTAGRTPSNAWQWSRTAATRRAMLHAAREAFTERGFAESGVADVVRRAGSSVGSLYHHFGGKTELFLALWEEAQAAHEQGAANAVAAAREKGVTDPLELFVIGARAFLEVAWDHRDLVRLFMDGDGPPGFELLRRTRGREWVRKNAVLLGASADPVDRVTVAVLTTIIGEAGREIAACDTEDEAQAVTDVTIGLIRRIGPLPAGDA